MDPSYESQPQGSDSGYLPGSDVEGSMKHSREFGQPPMELISAWASSRPRKNPSLSTQTIYNFTLTQRNYTRVATAYAFCWIASYISYAYFVSVVMLGSKWSYWGDSSSFGQFLWSFTPAVFLFLYLLFHIGHYVAAMYFFFLSGMTLYVCILDRETFQFYSPKT